MNNQHSIRLFKAEVTGKLALISETAQEIMILQKMIEKLEKEDKDRVGEKVTNRTQGTSRESVETITDGKRRSPQKTARTTSKPDARPTKQRRNSLPPAFSIENLVGNTSRLNNQASALFNPRPGALNHGDFSQLNSDFSNQNQK